MNLYSIHNKLIEKIINYLDYLSNCMEKIMGIKIRFFCSVLSKVNSSEKHPDKTSNYVLNKSINFFEKVDIKNLNIDRKIQAELKHQIYKFRNNNIHEHNIK